MLINSEFKIYEFKVPEMFSKWQKRALYHFLVQTHLEYKSLDKNYKVKYYNYEILRYKKYFDNLYNYFVNQCNLVFGQINFLENNSCSCWAQVSGLEEFKQYKLIRHDHKNTSVINSVFYFSLPNNNDGEIHFYQDNKTFTYQPKENTLLIFPCYLEHAPGYCNSNEYRIAINMELMCKEDVWNQKGIRY